MKRTQFVLKDQIGRLSRCKLKRKRLRRRSWNHVFDTATTSMLQFSFDSNGYGVKNPTSYILDLICLTSLLTHGYFPLAIFFFVGFLHKHIFVKTLHLHISTLITNMGKELTFHHHFVFILPHHNFRCPLYQIQQLLVDPRQWIRYRLTCDLSKI